MFLKELKMKSKILLLLVFCFIGCNSPNQNQKLYKYSVKLTRPDGVVHKTFEIESTGQPIMRSTDGGQSEFFEAEKYNGEWTGTWNRHLVPVGWLVEIEPLELALHRI
jgi:hypothetical protein